MTGGVGELCGWAEEESTQAVCPLLGSPSFLTQISFPCPCSGPRAANGRSWLQGFNRLQLIQLRERRGDSGGFPVPLPRVPFGIENFDKERRVQEAGSEKGAGVLK